MMPVLGGAVILLDVAAAPNRTSNSWWAGGLFGMNSRTRGSDRASALPMTAFE